MRVRNLVLAIATALGACSCGDTLPPAADAGGHGRLVNDTAAPRNALPPMTASDRPNAAGHLSAGAAAARPPGEAHGSSTAIPPRDAKYTILVCTIGGPDHVAQANDLKENSIRVTHRTEWYVIHARDESSLYFGFYRTTKDSEGAAESRRAHADHDFVTSLTVGQNGQLFKLAAFVDLAAPDPTAPPEWNLWNKDVEKSPKDPSRAYWSLQIMAFRNNELRKQAAVQAVQALRRRG